MRFSQFFSLDRTQPYLDFVDIRLDTDTAIFIDPTAIKAIDTQWGNELSSLLQSFFECVLNNIRAGNNTRAKELLASLNERNEFHLGYSKGKSSGHAFGAKSAETVWDALSGSQAAVTGLLKDLEDSCLLIVGIGPDMISDAVSNILRGPLIRYTQDMCEYYGIPLTDDVDSGPIWEPTTERWVNKLLPLPITDFGKVVLVPKNLVRLKICYKSDEYYRHYLLPEMQMEELRAKSSLVKVLKNGNERVTKKDLMEKYGSDKLAVVRETIKRPAILERYRVEKKRRPLPPISIEQLSEISETETPDWDSLILELNSIPVGRESASRYESLIEKIFSSMFFPSLCYPKKQHEIHNGRKRIDITYSNEAKAGFFAWVSNHFPAALIFVECKNYGQEIGNPELDQLSGRFSPSRGKVGLLVCREISDKALLMRRCIDTAADHRGFILSIDDDDIKSMIEDRKRNGSSAEYPLLRKKFNSLIS